VKCGVPNLFKARTLLAQKLLQFLASRETLRTDSLDGRRDYNSRLQIQIVDRHSDCPIENEAAERGEPLIPGIDNQMRKLTSVKRMDVNEINVHREVQRMQRTTSGEDRRLDTAEMRTDRKRDEGEPLTTLEALLPE
jgi:hypothetical protein